eukprot:COSAG02_NODE_12711_length_1505_cov_1.527027_3_plen_113_part_01
MFLGIGTDTRWISDTCVRMLVVVSPGPSPYQLFETTRREVVLVFKDDLPLNEFVEVCLPLPASAPPHLAKAGLLRDRAQLTDRLLCQAPPGLNELLNRFRLQLPETLSSLNYS